jgi:hypothetical protein
MVFPEEPKLNIEDWLFSDFLGDHQDCKLNTSERLYSLNQSNRLSHHLQRDIIGNPMFYLDNRNNSE